MSIDEVDDDQWSSLVDQFVDASVYQTGPYGVVRWGRKRLSRMVLLRGEKVVSIAQVALAGLTKARTGIAFVRWGPLWRRSDGDFDQRTPESMARALRDEYVWRRGLYLRVIPNAMAGTTRGEEFELAFGSYERESFKAGESYRTIEVDLSGPLDVVRKGLDQKWRNQLNRAERNGLVVRAGDGPRAFEEFLRMYQDMVARKRFAGGSDPRDFERMQRLLSGSQRMNVLLCEEAGQPVAGVVGTQIGDSAIYLFGATTEQGMKAKGAYLLQWRMIEWARSRGAKRYDLGGINPETNPGVHHFKAGMGGKDLLYLPPFASCRNPASRVFVRTAEAVRPRLRDVLARIRGQGALPDQRAETPG